MYSSDFLFFSDNFLITHIRQMGRNVIVSLTAFKVPNARTAHATIVVHGQRRTIFSERANDADNYWSHLSTRFESADLHCLSDASGVIVGHLSLNVPDGSSECTESILRRYSGKCPVLVNFGQRQLETGYHYWREHLGRDSILQFNLSEAKTFFNHLIPDASLADILASIK